MTLRTLVGVVLAVAVSMGSSASASPTLAGQEGPQRGLAVSSFAYGDTSFTAIVLSLDRATHVRLSVPAGYAIDLTRPVGQQIGSVSALLVDAAGTDDSAFEDGDLVVRDVALYASDPTAQRCSPGAHSAIWGASFSVLGGQTFDLPIFIDEAPAGSGSGYTIELCPQWEPSAVLLRGISAFGLVFYVLDVITPPDQRGSYLWNAAVTPAALGSFSSLPSRAYELRAIVPVPHVLTLQARYQPRTKRATLSGRLTALGEPEAGVRLSFYAYDERPRSSTDFGPVTTDSTGRFSLRRRVTRTTQFTASVESGLEPRACTSTSSAPGGCLETVSAPPPAYANVVVRLATDPALRTRRADQARARRALLKLSDFPAGWEAVLRNPFPQSCSKLKLDLSDLTATGEATSPDFITDEAGAGSEATVYASEAEAHTAFGREARIAAARCAADAYRRAEITNLKVAPLAIPRVGAETQSFRISFTYEGEPYVVDLVWFRRGRAVCALGFGSEGELAIEQELVRKVAARAGTG